MNRCLLMRCIVNHSMRTVRITLGITIAISTIGLYQRNCKSSEIDAVLQKAVERGDVPGVVAVAATSEGIIYQAPSASDLLKMKRT